MARDVDGRSRRGSRFQIGAVSMGSARHRATVLAFVFLASLCVAACLFN